MCPWWWSRPTIFTKNTRSRQARENLWSNPSKSWIWPLLPIVSMPEQGPTNQSTVDYWLKQPVGLSKMPDKPKMSTKMQVSAGGVAFRSDGDQVEVALISVGVPVRWQLP